MRDLTKSSLSFSWSMSLFGLQQLGNMLAPGSMTRPWGRMAEAFERVAGAMEKQLGNTLAETYRAGDKLQRGVVDLMFRAMGGQAMNPPAPAQGMARGCRPCAGAAWGPAGPRAEAAPDWAGSPPPSAAADGWQDRPTGWGPIPAAEAGLSPDSHEPTYAGGQR